MTTYLRIAYGLTVLVAVLGLMVGLADWPVWTVAAAGVVAGLWWGFGKAFAGEDVRGYRAERAERRARRARERTG